MKCLACTPVLILFLAACSSDNGGGTSNTQTTTGGAGAGGTMTGTAGVAGMPDSVAGGAGMAGATAGSGGTMAGAGGASGGAAGASGAGGTGGGGGGGAGNMAQTFSCPAGPFDAPVPGTPETVCQGFTYNYGFNEGPTWLESEQAFFFSNFVQGAQGGNVEGDIIKYTPGGDCEIFIEGSGTNGLAAGLDGNIIGASHKMRAIAEFDVVTKMSTVLANDYMGQMLDSPNDLIVHSNGGIYFSNPIYELGGRPQGVGPALFWLQPNGTLTAIEQGPIFNGIALSPDETKLYVVGGGVYDVAQDGSVSNKQAFNDMADGLAMDCAGNLYRSTGSIVNPQGMEIGTFQGGTNLAFGGADNKTLFVVGPDTQVHVIPMNVPGFP